MAEQKDIMLAKEVFNTFCAMLDEEDWHYTKDEEKLKIECGAKGEDLPMEFVIVANPETCVLTVFSILPYKIPEDKRLDVAVCVSAVNNYTVNGVFDYDIKDGTMFFRMANPFMDSRIGKQLCKYLLLCSCQTIDDYNDKFLMLSKGILSVEKFIESLND